MANTIPASGTHFAHYGFNKLIVHDLEKTGRFYEQVAGLKEWRRVEAEASATTGGPMQEITYLPTAEGGPSLTLIRFLDSSGPARGESILGFVTTDLAAFVKRATEHGGVIVKPIRDMPEHGIRLAFVEDPEGHLIEVVEMYPVA